MVMGECGWRGGGGAQAGGDSWHSLLCAGGSKNLINNKSERTLKKNNQTFGRKQTCKLFNETICAIELGIRREQREGSGCGCGRGQSLVPFIDSEWPNKK